jgi:hypothetical protein
VQTTFDHIVYSDISGACRNLFVGSWKACLDYVTANPRGPFGGSTHVRVRGL